MRRHGPTTIWACQSDLSGQGAVAGQLAGTRMDATTIDAAFKLGPAANVGVVLGPRSGLVDFECDGVEAERTLLDLFQR